MITIDLFGGLGNQMFQYALGRHLAIKNNAELTLRFIDVGAFSKREYELGCYKLTPGLKVVDETITANPAVYRVKRILARFSVFKKSEEFLIREKSFPFDPSILELTGENLHLFGYWQSEKYFKDIREAILEDFTFIEPLSSRNQQVIDEIDHSNSVSIHVRRGDYVVDPKTKQFHGICGPDYYQKAIDLVAEKVKDPIFYFFSDDPDWVKENLSAGKKSIYIDWNVGRQSHADMQLMSHCQHNILANSSFSWWGAWLNRNPNKLVIVPEPWFQDPSVDAKDLVPSRWVKMKS